MANNKSVETHGNIIMVDPNSININRITRDNVEFVNGIPQYQDMYIFAELTAESKGRTVLEVGGKSTSTNSQTINLLGNNQNKEDNPNYLNFTTNYYDGSTGNKIQYESFGITNINVKINSSYVPQVNIQFVDVRGLSFFNQENSPYRILFDFPPPIFKLTIKGYYGKPITYQLHLLKYTTEFQAQTGNFVIDAQFVAMTFAPLSDVLFRYIVNFPLIDDPKSADPNASARPLNTNSLILKLKNLYTGVDTKVKQSAISKNYDNTKKNIETIDSVFQQIKGFKNSPELNSIGENNLFLIIKNSENESSDYTNGNVPIQVITDLSQYDEIIKSKKDSGISVNDIKDRLSIVCIGSIDITDNNVSEENNYINNNSRISDLQNSFNKFSNRLLKISNNLNININETDINKSSSFFSDICISPYLNNRTQYVELDITNFYVKLFKGKSDSEKTKDDLGLEIASEINKIVTQTLGMMPTIYNIFEVILNDVDIFFNKLRTTARKAEELHNKNINIIMNDSRFKDFKGDKIYAFPLVIRTGKNDVEERIAPIDFINEDVRFPEIELVQEFINTFKNQAEYALKFELKSLLNDDGSYKWIPISPQDSILTGNSPESPYLDITDNSTDEIYKILLNRYYMLSQGILSRDFYDKNGNRTQNAYIEHYANAEAINLSLALNSLTSNQLLVDINKIKTSDDFYKRITGSTNIKNLYDFSENEVEKINITPNKDINGVVYVNKNNPDYQGMQIFNDNISTQELNEKSNKPIDEFMKNAKIGNIINPESVLSNYGFTNENVIYIRDVKNKNTITIESYDMDTRFICPKRNDLNNKRGKYWDYQIDAYKYGNKNTNEKYYDNTSNIMTLWEDILIPNGKLIYDEFNNSQNTNICSMLILSNFGYTLSPFSAYPNQLNSTVFKEPAVVEVPKFLNAYVGCLLTAIEKEWDGEIIDFFTGNTLGSNLPNKGYYVLADLHNVDKYLSIKDKETFKSAYAEFMESGGDYQTIYYKLMELINYVVNVHNDLQLYDFYLNPNSQYNSNLNDKGKYFDIFRKLITKSNIVNFNQSTFEIKELDSYYQYYKSLADINKDDKLKKINDNFFTKFFQNLRPKLEKNIDELKDEDEKQKKIQEDIDIITQTYYSFKNVNDKWLTGTGDSNDNIGYPFNERGQRLIDKFAFVDRAMNPIADTIINAEALVEIFNDPNITVFTALSQLLSANGFEFFPLQNFLSFENNKSWEDCFKIQTGSIDDTPSSHFVCMYIGGSSSYPSVDSNGFKNDGIIDLTNTTSKDFSVGGENNGKTKKELLDDGTINGVMANNNSSFPWREVRAFRVRFAEQNQSMFIDMKIDSKEYPETNESIQILSRLAGDNKNNAPTPKAQNLYNLYENRAYGATVTMLGNAMIQPTQYFQLENIPLFNGAYMILNVEHSITPNKMTTTFSGTKILQYPIPRVTSPFAFTSFEGEFASMSSGEITRGAVISEYNQTKINAMYNLTIG